MEEKIKQSTLKELRELQKEANLRQACLQMSLGIDRINSTAVSTIINDADKFYKYIKG